MFMLKLAFICKQFCSTKLIFVKKLSTILSKIQNQTPFVVFYRFGSFSC